MSKFFFLGGGDDNSYHMLSEMKTIHIKCNDHLFPKLRSVGRRFNEDLYTNY